MKFKSFSSFQYSALVIKLFSENEQMLRGNHLKTGRLKLFLLQYARVFESLLIFYLFTAIYSNLQFYYIEPNTVNCNVIKY